MPKPGSLHPNAKTITVCEPDGHTYQVLSSYGKEQMNADISPSKHPAWNKDITTLAHKKTGQVSKFQDRFGIDFADMDA